MAKKHGNGAMNSPKHDGGRPLSAGRSVASTGEPPSQKSQPPSEFFSDSENPDSPERKKPGRPKGCEKIPGSGRKKGRPSVLGSEARKYLAGASGYLDVLARVCKGAPVRMSGPTGKKTWHHPDWPDRKWALELIASKCIPTMAASEISGPDQTPLATEYTDKEWARRLAYLLTKPGTGGEDVVAELMEGTEGSAEDPPSSGRSVGGGAALGTLSAPATALPPSRGNGAAPAPVQEPVSEDFAPKKPKPATEPLVGQSAFVAGFTIKCFEPQRPGLPNQYEICGSNGALLAMACDGFQGALRWIRHRVPDGADMTVEVRGPVRGDLGDGFGDVRPDQYETRPYRSMLNPLPKSHKMPKSNAEK